MSAMGNVIAAKIMALNQEEKAAVLSFCVGYGCDDPLTKSADAALMCLKGGILLPAEHAEKCTCCADYRAKPKTSATFRIVATDGTKRELGRMNEVIEWVKPGHGAVFISEDQAIDWADEEISNHRHYMIVKDGGEK